MYFTNIFLAENMGFVFLLSSIFRKAQSIFSSMDCVFLMQYLKMKHQIPGHIDFFFYVFFYKLYNFAFYICVCVL